MFLFRQTSVTLLFICGVSLSATFACGYSFVGSCASAISLSINGTRDSFQLSPCEFEPPMDGLNLGSIYGLRLSGANTTTWESCINNVTNVYLYYRVYEKGGTVTNWQSFAMMEDSSRIEGPYTTRHRSRYPDYDLLKSLAPGKQYVLETYMLADIDTLGDDFIPETYLLLNNNGKNYQLTFTYGGAAAPPFIVLATRKIATRCYGDSTGIAGVTVYGNQTGIFYAWSGYNNNFHTLYQLPLGTYTVRVSGVNNYAQVVTIAIGQPTPIVTTFSEIEPAGCNNTAGHVKVSASGGNAPYNYSWNTGQQGEIANIPTPGIWRVTVTDAGSCKKIFSVNIPGDNSVAQRQLQAEICSGETYVVYGRSFKEPGAYTFTLPNPGGCDTLVSLQLSVVQVSALTSLLPDSALIVCLSPIIDLCGKEMANATFKWSKEGVALGNGRCVQATSGGHYRLSATLSGSTKVCTVLKDVLVLEKFTPPTLSLQTTTTATCTALDSIDVLFEAQTNAVEPVFEWKIEGKLVPGGKRCRIKLGPDHFFINDLSVSVRDKYGCRTQLDNLSFTGIRPEYLAVASVSMTAASGKNKSDGAAGVSIQGGNPPYAYHWDNNATTSTLTGVQPGVYCVTVRDAAGCTVNTCVRVDYSSAVGEIAASFAKIYPNPAYPGASLRIEIRAIDPDISSIDLFDAKGQFLLRQLWPLTDGAISLPTQLAPGFVVLKFNGLQKVHFEKLMLFQRP